MLGPYEQRSEIGWGNRYWNSERKCWKHLPPHKCHKCKKLATWTIYCHKATDPYNKKRLNLVILAYCCDKCRPYYRLKIYKIPRRRS